MHSLNYLSTWRTLAETYPLNSNQNFFCPQLDYCPTVVEKPYIPQPLPEITRSSTPRPPAIDNVLLNTDSAAFWGFSVSFSLSECLFTDHLQSFSQPEELQRDPSHWILYPVFNGKSLYVSIDSSNSHYNWESKWIQICDGIASFQVQGGHSRIVNISSIHLPIIPPSHTCKSLLAVVMGDHAGKLVRCITWSREDSEWHYHVACAHNAATPNESLEEHTLMVFPWQVVQVKENSDTLKHGRLLIQELRVRLQIRQRSCTTTF